MEQLNYSFFLLVLGDRLLKTDGRRSVHTLAGEAGCSRSADGRADSCLVASRHLGNCLSLTNVCGALVTPCHSDTFSWGPTKSHARAHKILHSLIYLTVYVASYVASDPCKCSTKQTPLLKSHLFASTSRSPFPIALQQPFKTDVIVTSFVATGFPPSCKLSEAACLEGDVACWWQECQQGCRPPPQSPALEGTLLSAFAHGFWVVLSEET